MKYNCQFLITVMCIVSIRPGESVVQEPGACRSDQQRGILSSVLGCAPRDEIVHMDLPNETFVHVVPNHVTVKRCGGSCNSRYDVEAYYN